MATRLLPRARSRGSGHPLGAPNPTPESCPAPWSSCSQLGGHHLTPSRFRLGRQKPNLGTRRFPDPLRGASRGLATTGGRPLPPPPAALTQAELGDIGVVGPAQDAGDEEHGHPVEQPLAAPPHAAPAARRPGRRRCPRCCRWWRRRRHLPAPHPGRALRAPRPGRASPPRRGPSFSSLLSFSSLPSFPPSSSHSGPAQGAALPAPLYRADAGRAPAASGGGMGHKCAGRVRLGGVFWFSPSPSTFILFSTQGW